jgi:hypothetical protein
MNVTAINVTAINVTTKSDNFRKLLTHAGMQEKPHQLAGVRWCLENELRSESYFPGPRIRGGFIADEMGLGKTITMIGTIFCNFKMPTLIVMPVVLLQQWHREIRRATGHKAAIYHGKNKALLSREKLEKCPIVLTTYGAVTINKKNIQLNALHEIKWHRVIFDEAHHLRNKKTGRFMGAKLLNANIRWLVSGTPVQNKKDDFYALCNLLRIPASVYTDPTNISLFSRHFILKRTKGDAGIQLPKVVYQSTIVPWDSPREQRFSANIHSLLGFSGTLIREKDDSLQFKNQQTIQLLTRAKQSCILPRMALKALDQSCENATLGSSKMDAVCETIIERKNNGNGKLVFSHYKQEIDTIVKRLREGRLERIAILDGRLSMSERGKILSEKYDVLILQIQTGCEGLNLQDNYSEIYFVTPHWNPAVEDQAVARCHRIGQTKPVSVFRFEMEGFENGHAASTPGISFDNYVTFVQGKKREISKQFL